MDHLNLVILSTKKAPLHPIFLGASHFFGGKIFKGRSWYSKASLGFTCLLIFTCLGSQVTSSNPFFPLKIPLGLRQPAASSLNWKFIRVKQLRNATREQKKARRCVFPLFFLGAMVRLCQYLVPRKCIGEIVGTLRTREYG